MSTKINLSNNLIPTLPKGSYSDERQKGLILKVTAVSRTFSFYGWLHSRPTKKVIGKWPDIDLKIARKLVQEMWQGERPEEQPATVGELVKLYARDHMDQTYRLNWTCYADTPIDKLKVLELQRKHDEIAKERGPMAAHRAIRALRILCNYAIRMEVATRNPALNVDIEEATKRNVFLEPAEIEIMKRCLESMGREPRDFFKLALLTGMRKSNILGMRKAWVRLEDSTVTVPAEESKNGEELTICLSPAAAEIIRSRMPGDNPFIFPGRVSGHVSGVSSWIADLRRRMREHGVHKHFTTHDLRRTFATELTRKGAPLVIVSKALGHSSLDTTAIYARTSMDTVKDWVVQ